MSFIFYASARNASLKNFYCNILLISFYVISFLIFVSAEQVFIQVQNENDNVPLTENAVYYPSIPEGSPAGEQILQIIAEDRDIDPLQRITYRITSGNPEGFFTINSTTGKYKHTHFAPYRLNFMKWK